MITRNALAATRQTYDLIAVGGGIYGASLALEASRRGLRSLVLEQSDFGGSTSWNSMRIVHGGLRYLQSLDLVRFRESVTERRWFLQHFPDLIQPLRCLMPLYGRGLKRPPIMRIALALNDLLSADRNREVESRARLGRGRVLSVEDTVRVFPRVERSGLAGAGEWWDAAMMSPPRVLMEILRWACSHGATALNYVAADGLTVEDGRVVGVTAEDRLTGEKHEYAASTVVNCAGPWSRAFTGLAGGERPALFRASLAFNLLLDVPPRSDSALAVAPAGRGEPVYFLYPYRGKVMAGTVHAAWHGGTEEVGPSAEQIAAFIADLNSAVPGLGATPERVLRVFAGLLPTTHEGGNKLTKRPVIIDHGRDGGPRGLVSISGIKLTTARLVTEQILKRLQREGALRSHPVRPFDRQPVGYGLDLVQPDELLHRDPADVRPVVERILREESVITLQDLVLRRTGWGDEPAMGDRVMDRLATMFPEWPRDALPGTVSEHRAAAV